MITCNDVILPVTKNLFEALQRFRYSDKPRAIWIDQLCIDQSNLLERSQQVQIMQKIYAKARCVLIWLGEAANNSEDAMQFVGTLVSHFGNNFNQREYDTVYTSSLLAKMDLPAWESPIWTALGYLLTRPYFERVWVVQEAVYAQDAVVVCASKSLPWSTFLGLIQHCGNFGMHLITACIQVIRQPSVETQDAIGHLQAIWELKRNLEQKRNKESNDGLAEILATHRGCKASDPRDKVLSLLGVMPEAQQRKYDAPDYSKSLETIYIETARRCIMGSHTWPTLNILHSAGKAMQAHKLPSWVPDWSVQRSSVAFEEKHFTMYLPIYSATGLPNVAPETYVNWSNDPSVLILRGKIVASIAEIGPELNSQDENQSKERIRLRTVERVLRTESDIEACLALAARLEPDPQSLQAVRSACRQTLLGGKSRTWMAMLHHAGRFGEGNADTYFEDFEKYASAVKSGNSLATGYAATSNAFELLHREATMGRTFFVTDRYMGLGPIGIRKGDKIAIIFGLRAPFILREEDGMYALIGDSYVGGIMQGEAMEMADIPVEDIHLK